MPLYAEDTGLVEYQSRVSEIETETGDSASSAGTPAADTFARLRELEARAGVFNGDALLAERAALAATLAPLDAIVGPAGVGEAQVKAFLFALAAEHRTSFEQAGTKVTETRIEEAARSDPRYKAKLDEMVTLRTEYVIIRALIDNLTSRLQWAMAVMRYAANEPKGV